MRTIVVVIGIVAIILLPRLFDLDQFQTADEKRWLANVRNFTTALAHGRWDELFQQPHPGITTQWLAAPTAFSDEWANRKLPLVVSQSALVLMIGYVFGMLWGMRSGVGISVLLAVNPLLVAHTRIYAMDSLLALFLLLSVGLLLLWGSTRERQYLIFSGIAGALAVLSKLPGIFIVPFALGYVMYVCGKEKLFASLAIWTLAFFVTLPIVLPSLVTNTIPVLQDVAGFFLSDDYTELHPASHWYYLRTLIFFSTPLQLVALIAMPFFWKRIEKDTRVHVAALLLFTVGFVLMMSMGSKMGDRYILPSMIALDVIVVVLILEIRKWKMAIAGFTGILVLLVWQATDIVRLHPYTLAYVNPITKPLFGERRLGWGEGLDLAAEYLNKKSGASGLKVAAYYPVEFSEYFAGEAVPLHQWDSGSVDYAILYRAMLERGESAWETDVISHFRNQSPEHVIRINGLEYAWIYRLSDRTHSSYHN